MARESRTRHAVCIGMGSTRFSYVRAVCCLVWAAGLLQSMGPGLVGLAIIIGFLPGCGPQILVTSLYLNGAVPFSAQLGNAISNDGDALFPAIALSPKAALIATVYSAIPAFLVGYGYWYLFE